MVQSPSPPLERHPILAAIQDIILPNIAQGIGRVIPLVEDETPRGGQRNYAEIFPFGLHRHDFYEWMWLLEKETHININGAVHQLSGGDFCLLPPNVLHAELNSAETQLYRSLWCCYSGDSDVIYCTLCSIAPSGHMHASVFRVGYAPPLIGSLLGMLEREMRGRRAYTDLMCQGLASTLAHLLARAFETSVAFSDDKASTDGVEGRVVKYLHDHYAEDIGTNDVARAVGVSTNYLCAAFKRETAETIGERLTKMRLERAKLLLLKNQFTIGEVAKAVGYDSPARFCRIFHRHEGMPPSRYGKW